jgi:hypothetical protein
MSADAWRVCPNCLKNQTKPPVYGEVSESEFKKWVIETAKDDSDEAQLLREDYQIYMRKDGVLVIEYSCSCYKCSAKFSYNKEVKASSIYGA